LRTSRERGTAIEVLDPSGKRALTLEEAAKAETLALGARGYYDIRRPSGRHELVAVNPDRRESDFELLPAETLALWQNTGQGATASPGQPGEAEKPPVSFWWYLMLATLVISLAETLVGNRHLNVDKEAA
ncbi:MAG: hypothetical protein ACRD96_25560, partial [Bryobacteraceae bacterium]